MSSQTLKSKAVLVTLSLGCWGAHAMDAEASTEVEANRKVQVQGMARVWKSLLVDNTYFKAVQTIQRKARAFHNKNTYPWKQEGTGILTTANYLSYMDYMREAAGELAKAVEVFLEDLPKAQAEAATALNSLYKAEDYPSAVVLRRKFYLSTMVLPVPEGTMFAAEVGEEEAQKVRQNIEESVAEAFRDAHREMWDRLFQTINHMQTQLAKPKGIKQTTINGIREMLELLNRMNVTGDERLERLRVQALERLGSTTARELNDDANARKSMISEARKISDSMAAFMGDIAHAS